MKKEDLKTFVSLVCDQDNLNTLKGTLRYTADEINGGGNISRLKTKALPDKPYTPTKGDKIYFLAGCTVPRFKVKQFCEAYGVALVKDSNKANVKFMGPDSFNNMFNSYTNYFFKKHVFVNYFKPMVIMTDQMENLFKMIEESTMDIVEVNYSLHKALNQMRKYVNVAPDIKYTFNDLKAANDYVLLTTSSDIYSQNEILKKINTGGVLGKEQYESIQRMFESTDVENVKLAMEAMANSDYEQSCAYLLLLMTRYGQKMYVSPTRNHVNFKSLLKFFDIDHRNIPDVDVNRTMNTLIEKRLLNKSNLDILMREVVILMKEEQGEEPFFQVASITPTEKVYDSLNNNILDGVCDTEVVEYDEEELSPKSIPSL